MGARGRQRILVTGAQGFLGAYLMNGLRDRPDVTVAALQRRPEGTFGGSLDCATDILDEVKRKHASAADQVRERAIVPVYVADLRDEPSVRHAFRAFRPDVVIHAAAMASMAACHAEPATAFAVNAAATALVTRVAKDVNPRAFVVYASTDMVFAGDAAPYAPDRDTAPSSTYGRSKARGEELFLAAGGDAIARLSLLYGPSLGSKPSFWDHMTAAFVQGESVSLFRDEWRTPLSYRLAAAGLVEIGCDGLRGLWHFGGPQKLSRVAMGEACCAAHGWDPSFIRAISQNDVPSPEPRPRDLALDARAWHRETLVGRAVASTTIADELRLMGAARSR